MEPMEREQLFHPGDTVRHFKRDAFSEAELEKEPTKYLYEIIGVAEHTESGERMMVYRALYGDKKLFARPLAAFLSPVDKRRYPTSKQDYRFEVMKK